MTIKKLYENVISEARSALDDSKITLLNLQKVNDSSAAYKEDMREAVLYHKQHCIYLEELKKIAYSLRTKKINVVIHY